jgi:ribosomal protein L29
MEHNKGAKTMSTPTLEERIAVLEAEAERLKQQKEADQLDKSDEITPWWKRIVGVHADSPGFEEAVRLGREWRESEDVPEIEGAA